MPTDSSPIVGGIVGAALFWTAIALVAACVVAFHPRRPR